MRCAAHAECCCCPALPCPALQAQRQAEEGDAAALRDQREDALAQRYEFVSEADVDSEVVASARAASRTVRGAGTGAGPGGINAQLQRLQLQQPGACGATAAAAETQRLLQEALAVARPLAKARAAHKAVLLAALQGGGEAEGRIIVGL